MISPKSVLRLAIPQNNTRGPLAFEAILASLHGLISLKHKGKKSEVISFEISKVKGLVHFYIITPSYLEGMIRSQFYSQYPEVEIFKCKEYLTKGNIKGKNVLCADLRPKNSTIYPFKRYSQFIDPQTGEFEDPIGSITSALSHLNESDDVAMIQILVAPVETSWNEDAQDSLLRFTRGGPWKWKWLQKKYTQDRLEPQTGNLNKRGKTWWRMANTTLAAVSPSEEEQRLRQGQTSQKHEKESITEASHDKLSRLHFYTNIRILYATKNQEELPSRSKLREIVGTFQQFTLPQINQFVTTKLETGLENILFRDLTRRRFRTPFALSQEELSTVFHLPTESVKTPSISWVRARKIEPPINLPGVEDSATAIGRTNFRDNNQVYGIKREDRRRHVYVIGKTGMGKSTLLENMIFSDIAAGYGVGVVDPHGDLAEAVIDFVPKSRINDVIIFDPSDVNFPVSFNILEGKNKEHRTLIASGVVGVFKKLYGDSWGPRLEHILRNTVLALVEAPDTTMLGITRMLVDPGYRKKILKYVEDPMVISFWRDEFDKMPPQKLSEAVGPIQNKVGQFLSSPIVRNILGQPKSTIDMRFAMDKGKIVIVNLSKGKIGEDNAAMLGSLMITKFQLDAMSRADIAESERKDFFLYVDEFQNFATESFSTILSEARKYRLSLTMANQFLEQMEESVAAAVFGNVGSLISFQVGIDDAKILSEQMDEERVLPIDLASLPKYKIYNRIMMDGVTSPVFSADSLAPPELNTDPDHEAKVRKVSRARYTTAKEVVEDKINRWMKGDIAANVPKEKKDKKDKKKS